MLSAICYGLIPLFVLPLNRIGFPLDSTLFYRFSLAALFLLGFLMYRRESLRVTGREMSVLLVLGVLFALSSELLFLGYTHLSPGIASTVMFIYPLVVAVIMAIGFREKLTLRTALCLGITLLGVCLLSIKDDSFSINGLGLTVTVLCAVCYAVYIVVVNKARISGSGAKISFYSMVFSALYYLLKIVLTGNELAQPSVPIIGYISLFALVTTLVSILALVIAIRLIGSTRAAISGALEPVVAVLISVLLFGEAFTWSLFVGMILIVFGVVWVLLDQPKIGRAHV